MFCVLGDEKINAGLIARAGLGAERKDKRKMGMMPCRSRVENRDQEILGEERIELKTGGRKGLEQGI